MLSWKQLYFLSLPHLSIMSHNCFVILSFVLIICDVWKDQPSSKPPAEFSLHCQHGQSFVQKKKGHSVQINHPVSSTHNSCLHKSTWVGAIGGGRCPLLRGWGHFTACLSLFHELKSRNRWFVSRSITWMHLICCHKYEIYHQPRCCWKCEPEVTQLSIYHRLYPLIVFRPRS